MALLASSNEKCLSLLYNLIKLTKNNIFDILIELFDRVVFINSCYRSSKSSIENVKGSNFSYFYHPLIRIECKLFNLVS